jgi:hypothetical protein
MRRWRRSGVLVGLAVATASVGMAATAFAAGPATSAPAGTALSVPAFLPLKTVANRLDRPFIVYTADSGRSIVEVTPSGALRIFVRPLFVGSPGVRPLSATFSDVRRSSEKRALSVVKSASKKVNFAVADETPLATKQVDPATPRSNCLHRGWTERSAYRDPSRDPRSPGRPCDQRHGNDQGQHSRSAG